jgi:xylulokinase
MGVLLSAASCLSWWASISGHDEASLLSELSSNAQTTASFAPYLAGERTPHNDALVRGGFLGLDASHTRADLTLAVLEGVSYAMRDAQQALAAAGTQLMQADLLGGGARSPFWCQLMADVLGIPLHVVTQREIGCAIGAARLAAMAALGGGRDVVAQVATKPTRVATYEPRAADVERHAERHGQWQSLYRHAHEYQRAASLPELSVGAAPQVISQH